MFANDTCRLISLNLPGYIQASFAKTSEFDFGLFSQDVYLAMRMSDNLVQLEIAHFERILSVADSSTERSVWDQLKASAQLYRRTGLGTHGLADVFIRMGIRYDSEKAKELTQKIYECLRNCAYNASIELAKIRGPFPNWDWNKEKDCEFFKRMPSELIDKMKQYGRRNVSLLTIAPTGSISILSKSSSGIEPTFRNWYTRRKKVNHNEKDVRVDFVDQLGDRWQEYKVFHWALQEFLKIRNIKEFDPEKVPDYFITSDKIDGKKKIDLVSIAQSYIDHGISQTLNLPRETTVETVSELYFYAWKAGLKGFTIYREGSRTGVLLSQDSQYEARPKKIQRQGAPKRPESIPCDIHHTIVHGNPWVVIVGKFEGQPYEVFAGKAKKVQVPKKYTEGTIVKEKQGEYYLIFNDEMKLDIIDCFENFEQQAMTRLLSMSLRHGVPLPYIVAQLDKAEGSKITDLNKAIMRILKKYMKDEDVKMLKCDQCGESSLVFESGCFQCKSCGQSKCS